MTASLLSYNRLASAAVRLTAAEAFLAEIFKSEQEFSNRPFHIVIFRENYRAAETAAPWYQRFLLSD